MQTWDAVAFIELENSSNSTTVLMRLFKHGKKSSVAFIKYLLKIVWQGKENAVYLLLDRNMVFDTRAYSLPANQKGHLTTHNQSKFMWCHNFVYILSSKHTFWPMREHIQCIIIILSVVTIAIFSSLIGALTALFFTNYYCVGLKLDSWL